MTTSTASTVEGASRVSIADRLAPSLPAFFFIVITLFASLVAQHQLLNGDGDLARHLRHGMYMLQHHTLIWRDPFSFTRPGEPFVPFEYGSQLLFAVVFRATGLAGVTILASALIGATYAILARFLLRRGVDPLLVLVTTAAALVLGSFHWMARPHLISWLAIALFLGLVEYEHRPRLWLYPVFFAIWANFHGGWLYGIAVLGIYLAGHSIEYRFFGRAPSELAAVRHFALALPLSALGTLATPMGLRLWAHLRVHLGDTYVLSHTAEFESPDFHTLAAKMMLAIVLGALGTLLVSRRRMHFARMLIVLAGLWWLLTSVRNLALFGLTGLTVIALHLDAEWRGLRWAWLVGRRAGFSAGATSGSTFGWILLWSGLLASVAVGHGRLLGQDLLTDEFDEHVFPVAAVNAARQQHVEGRLFTEFIWGGYVLFAWPEQKVFIDGGTDFYGESVMRDFITVSGLEPNWRKVLDRWRIDLVLTRSDSKLAREIARSPKWEISYCDSVALLARRAPPAPRLVSGSSDPAIEHCPGLLPDSSTPADYGADVRE